MEGESTHTEHREGFMQHRILVAEDSRETREALCQILQAAGPFAVDSAVDGRSALEQLSRNSYSVCLTDLRMPGLDGMKLIEETRRRQLPVAVIVLTGFGGLNEAVQAMRLGAVDFLTKPVDPEHLKLVIERVLRERGLQAEVAALREKLQKQFEFHNVLSKAPSMH